MLDEACYRNIKAAHREINDTIGSLLTALESSGLFPAESTMVRETVRVLQTQASVLEVLKVGYRRGLDREEAKVMDRTRDDSA